MDQRGGLNNIPNQRGCDYEVFNNDNAFVGHVIVPVSYNLDEIRCVSTGKV